MSDITRKKHTGEAGNGGQFGSKTHSEADVSLNSPTGTPGVHVSRGSRLSAPQQKLLDDLVQAETFRSDSVILVSGREYQTALALERRGLATVRYQGPSKGWAQVANNLRSDIGQPVEAGDDDASVPSSNRSVPTTVRLLHWDAGGDVIEVDRHDFDLTAALDTLSTDELRELSDRLDTPDSTESLMRILRRNSIINHDGPFELNITREDLDGYLKGREAAGQHEPTRRVMPLEDKAEAMTAIARARAAADEANAQLQTAYQQMVQIMAEKVAPGAKQVITNPQGFPIFRDADGNAIDLDPAAESEAMQVFAGFSIPGSYSID